MPDSDSENTTDDVQRRVRMFVEDTVKATIGLNVPLDVWIARAVYEKMAEDVRSYYPQFGTQSPEIIQQIGSGYQDEHDGLLYLHRHQTVVLLKVISRRVIDVIRSSPQVQPDRQIAQKIADEINECSPTPCVGSAVLYIPFDSNNENDIWTEAYHPQVDEEIRLKHFVHSTALATITQNSSRDVQKLPGPSDLANPCDLCVARRIAASVGVDMSQVQRYFSLKAWLGTSLHQKLERDLPRVYPYAQQEITVPIVVIPELGQIKGHVDAYFPRRLTMGDWKGLALDTQIPTPTGWTTMGMLQTGEEVFDSSGNPCKVVAKSEVHMNKCYRIVFDDKSSVVCDDEHLWVTQSGEGGRTREKIQTTEEIQSTLHLPNGQAQHRVNVTSGLNLPDVNLPVDPYLLGCWLGDGTTDEARIHSADPEIFQEIEARGYEVGPVVRGGKEQCPARQVYKVRALLPLGDKHVPDVYLRASAAQRTDLLRGLMDTDGYWNSVRNQASFTSTKKVLALAVRELALSLGQRAVLHVVKKKGFGLAVTAYEVSFTPVRGLNPFCLPRKADKVHVPTEYRSKRRIIQSVEEIPTVPTQCIMVDSPDSTYLCTESMITTHNSTDKKKLDTIRARGVSSSHFGQTMLYMYGLKKKGLECDYATLTYIPRDSNKISDIWVASCAYREDVAVALLNRTRSLIERLKSGDVGSMLPADDCFVCTVQHRIRR